MQWTVNESEAGERLQQYLLRQLGADVSARQVKRWIDGNCCRVNGQVERFAKSPVSAGMKVQLAIPQEVATPEVLYEDDHLLGIDKPAGVTTEQLIAKWFPDALAVHRLDKETSGVLLLAKTKECQTGLEQLFYKREIEKTYLATVRGGPSQDQGVLDNFVAPIRRVHGQTVWGVADKGKRAITHWRVLERQGRISKIVCHPKTGRTHQVRVHMAHLGCPVVGDVLYGGRDQRKSGRHLLFAVSLSFIHPITGGELVIKARGD